jgi:N6-L-threonylcarbamoyladenine synthase
MENWANFQIIGQTLDDAVGEAFDKTARMLGLPYPGGPEVSKKAKEARDENVEKKVDLPRPMLKSETLDFSFSGLKTAVLYTIQKKEILDEEFIKDICREFEDSVTEVLIHKTERALIESNAKTLIIGGGVISNSYIRENFQKLINEKFKEVRLLIADKKLATDNAVMIAMAGYISHLSNKTSEEIKADGNLKLG